MRTLLCLLLVLSCGAAAAQTVPDKSPEDLVRFVYQQYVGKKPDDPVTFRWNRKPLVDRLFEPALARAVSKDGDGQEPLIDFDPFVDGQDFEIKSYSLKAEPAPAGRARITASFLNLGERRAVRYDLIQGKGGWRIHDISWGAGRGSFRRQLKVR